MSARNASTPVTADTTPIPAANVDQGLGVAIIRREIINPTRIIYKNAGKSVVLSLGYRWQNSEWVWGGGKLNWGTMRARAGKWIWSQRDALLRSLGVTKVAAVCR